MAVVKVSFPMIIAISSIHLGGRRAVSGPHLHIPALHPAVMLPCPACTRACLAYKRAGHPQCSTSDHHLDADHGVNCDAPGHPCILGLQQQGLSKSTQVLREHAVCCSFYAALVYRILCTFWLAPCSIICSLTCCLPSGWSVWIALIGLYWPTWLSFCSLI